MVHFVCHTLEHSRTLTEQASELRSSRNFSIEKFFSFAVACFFQLFLVQ